MPAPAAFPLTSRSLHDALPISWIFVAIQPPAGKLGDSILVEDGGIGSRFNASINARAVPVPTHGYAAIKSAPRSEEHTSELQSPCKLVCGLLLDKKKMPTRTYF